MRYTQIPESTFEQLQLNAGIIVDNFTPASGVIGNILGATNGGLSFKATAEFKDYGDDIDNCPKNMMQLKKLDSWSSISLSGTMLTVDTATAQRLVSAADIDSSDTTKIVPRNDLDATDFKDVWFVGDYSDKNGDTKGGHIAIHLKNTLNTSGFQLTTGDRDKGKFAFEFVAHYDMENQDEVPFEIYIKAGTAESSAG